MNASKKLEIVQAFTLACETMESSNIEKVWSERFQDLGGARGIFVVADPKYDKPTLPSDECIEGKCFVVGFLKGRRLALIQNAGSLRPFDYCYQLFADTNFISYCNTAFRGRPLGTVADAFFAAVDYLLPRRDELNALCYLTENFERRHLPEVRDSIQAFAAFKLADAVAFCGDRTTRPAVPKQELEVMTARITAPLETRDFKVIYDAARRNYLLSRVALTKAAAIALGSAAREPPQQRLLTLLRFFDQEVAMIPKRELIAAWRLYETKAREPFFQTVQRNAKDLLRSLHSMSWDLAHWRNAVMMATVTSGLEMIARFPLPYFLTFDRAYASLLSEFQLRGIVFLGDGKDYIPIYDGGSERGLAAALEGAEDLFTPAALLDRQRRKPQGDLLATHFERLAQITGQELTAIAGACG